MPDTSRRQTPQTIAPPRRKHPFRREALEKYQRAFQVDVPELTLRWHVALPALGTVALILAVLVW